MMYKYSRAGTMQKIQRCLSFLAVSTLFLTSCQSSTSLSVSQASDGNAPVVNSLISASEQTVVENNECLNCHSDKDRLIETAKPEAVVEAESKGVG